MFAETQKVDWHWKSFGTNDKHSVELILINYQRLSGNTSSLNMTLKKHHTQKCLSQCSFKFRKVLAAACCTKTACITHSPTAGTPIHFLPYCKGQPNSCLGIEHTQRWIIHYKCDLMGGNLGECSSDLKVKCSSRTPHSSRLLNSSENMWETTTCGSRRASLKDSDKRFEDFFFFCLNHQIVDPASSRVQEEDSGWTKEPQS